MEIEDLLEIVKLEKMCFTDPWSMESFVHEILVNRYAHYVVVVVNGQIVGYCGAWCIGDEGEITTIAVHPGFQKKGIGKFLLQYMMQYIRDRGGKNLYLEVRVSNEAAQKLYQKHGFTYQRIRKEYYPDQEDAIVMGVNLHETEKRLARTWN
jgi:ribosomal-protein-alanine N-acetyltransferase